MRSCCRPELPGAAPRSSRGRSRDSCGISARTAHRHEQRPAHRAALHVFPGARFVPIRGNLDTRLRKLDTGEFDALVLAAAGLTASGTRIANLRGPAARDVCVPAPGQGIIAVEVREAMTCGCEPWSTRQRLRRRRRR